jgi:prefoldin subunit 5
MTSLKPIQHLIQDLGDNPSPSIPSQAEAILAEAESLSDSLSSQIGSLSEQAEALQGQAQSLEQQLQTLINQAKSGGTLSPAEQAALSQSESDLSTTEQALNAIETDLSALSQDSGAISSYLTQIQSLESTIVSSGGTPDELAELQGLYQELQGVGSEVTGTDAPKTSADLTTLGGLVSKTLPADITALQAGLPDPSIPPGHVNGQTIYFDTGDLDSILSTLWNWQTNTLNTTAFDSYVNSILSQMKGAGITNIDFDFAQLSDVGMIASGGSTSNSTDTIASLMSQYPGALQSFIQLANQAGMTTTLSIGGEMATDADWTIPGIAPGASGPEAESAAAAYADQLHDLCRTLGINNLDFDIEDPNFGSILSPGVAQSFFMQLHSDMQGNTPAGQVSLSSDGDISAWPEGALAALFTSNGEPIFTKMFDSLNLMLYNDTTYYLSAGSDGGQNDFGVEAWLDLIGKENASMVHIGFDDGVNYASSSASGPGDPNYNINSTDPGVAAAEIYEQLLAQLKADGYPTNLGDPFWWPDEIDNSADKARYTPIAGANGTFSANFLDPNGDPIIQNFYQTLESAGIQV